MKAESKLPPIKEEVVKNELWFINSIEKYNKEAIVNTRARLKGLLTDQKFIHSIKKLIQNNEHKFIKNY